MSSTRQKLIAILGPTASGKTSLAVRLARHFRGEIISADSRQVFRGLDIGTGKDLKEYSGSDGSGRLWRVPYHLLDVIDPSEEYSLAQYQKAVLLAMAGIHQRGRIPFLAGGSGLYAQAVIDNSNWTIAVRTGNCAPRSMVCPRRKFSAVCQKPTPNRHTV